MLDARASDSDRIDLLESILTDRGTRHLTGDHHQRDRIAVCGGNPRHRVGRAGAGGHQRHTDLVGGAGIAVCRMNGGLLMTHQDMAHLVLLEQLVVDIKDRAAGITEKIFNLFFLETPDYNFCTGQ